MASVGELSGVLPQQSSLMYPQFAEVLNNMWFYYEAFLGQTLMLNAEPLQELALCFNNLKVSQSLSCLG